MSFIEDLFTISEACICRKLSMALKIRAADNLMSPAFLETSQDDLEPSLKIDKYELQNLSVQKKDNVDDEVPNPSFYTQEHLDENKPINE